MKETGMSERSCIRVSSMEWFPANGRFVSTSGQASVRLVAKHHSNKAIKLDLVQLIPIYSGTACEGGGGGGGGPIGVEGLDFVTIPQSDADKNDSVNMEDAARFLDLWLGESLGADFNNDGIVDENDLADFATDFSAEVAP